MRRILAVLLLSSAFVAGLALPAHAPQETRYMPCVTEDDPGPCYWDAQVQGNGQGKSFLVHEDGTVQYL